MNHTNGDFYAGFSIPFEDTHLLWQHLNSTHVASVLDVQPQIIPDRFIADIAGIHTVNNNIESTLTYKCLVNTGYGDLIDFCLLYKDARCNIPAFFELNAFDAFGTTYQDQHVKLSIEETRLLYGFLNHPEVQALYSQVNRS
ncbi:hypothetical protein [Dictyobacter kobayashii]|uniref:Uncharacterized protein n=1 Tax=Dictyobacter kobayashii TaxID=2014872 RepID=A0A402AIM6_9CHLR|nr:hypothetical protein [Dictyobacter kobayashii]GCE18981.1 hypothetical protein KDK_27810 [Dictyobacter kobayashii]